MIAFLNVEEDQKSWMKLIMIIVYTVMYIHFFACMWWKIIKFDEKWIWAGFMDTDDMY